MVRDQGSEVQILSPRPFLIFDPLRNQIVRLSVEGQRVTPSVSQFKRHVSAIEPGSAWFRVRYRKCARLASSRMLCAVNTLSAVTSTLRRNSSDSNLRSCSRHSFIFRAQTHRQFCRPTCPHTSDPFGFEALQSVASWPPCASYALTPHERCRNSTTPRWCSPPPREHNVLEHFPHAI